MWWTLCSCTISRWVAGGESYRKESEEKKSSVRKCALWSVLCKHDLTKGAVLLHGTGCKPLNCFVAILINVVFRLQFNSWPKRFLSSRNPLFYWCLWILSEIPSSVHFWAENNTLQKNSKGKHFSNIKAKSVFEFDSPTIFWQKCPDFKSNHPDSILPFGLLMQLSSKTLCTHSVTCKFICSCIHLMSTFRCTCNLS